MLMSGDDHHLWSWPENLEVDSLRICMDGQIVRPINIARIPLVALGRPPQLLSRLVRTAHDGVLVCSHQIWDTPGPKVSTLDIGLQDVDYLFHLQGILLHRL